jgi:uncharacterized protein YndB with AHSA1/START domain
MTKPDEASTTANPAAHTVPLRFELTLELPGTPRQVWNAIATANGISSWMLPTDLDPRVGGAICFHMGDELSSEGTVTDFDALKRFAYIEPDWATLAGHDRDSVDPLASEFLIEAQSGGTCVLRVVSSSFGTGAEWEKEFFADIEKGWTPQFDNLRIYLSHFADRQVVSMDVDARATVTADVLWPGLRAAIGARRVGDVVEMRGVHGVVERINSTPGPTELLVRTTTPVEGYFNLMAWTTGTETSSAVIAGRFFSDGAAAYVERERDGWSRWLNEIVATIGTAGGK